jgi:hypothetical protein
MDERPLHYESAPHIREAMEKNGKRHADLLLFWIQELQRLGADSNDVLSLIAHLAALDTAAALALIQRRMAELVPALSTGAGDAHAHEAMRIFMADVMARAIYLTTLGEKEAKP